VRWEDYRSLFEAADHQPIEAVLAEKNLWHQRKSVDPFKEALAKLEPFKAKSVDLSGDCIQIGEASEISEQERELLRETLRVFMPWRKGPFNLFGIEVDAEWRSYRKWNRIKPYLPDLEGKVIADIGCNNGYYMFRMSHYNPRFVLGVDPTLRFNYAFKSLNHLAGRENLAFELLGVEHMKHFIESFDVIFLMGILYHHPSPVEILKDLFGALKPGGDLIIETQTIPGEESLALFPEKRYAKVPGTYFVPTDLCLENFVKRAGYTDVDLFDTHPMSPEEQRRTEWMVFESYSDYLDPEDSTRTIEGYPAPHRSYLKARKRG
jgi:tRNA (mo5U34)-methyltransferase